MVSVERGKHWLVAGCLLTGAWWLAAANASAQAVDSAPRLLPPLVTVETDAAIARGLDYLARAQGRDGAWRNRTGYGAYPVAMSALAGLSFLGNGSTTTQGPYASNVDRVTEFLLTCTTESGLIARLEEAEGRPMYGHGFSHVVSGRDLRDGRGRRPASADPRCASAGGHADGAQSKPVGAAGSTPRTATTTKGR